MLLTQKERETPLEPVVVSLSLLLLFLQPPFTCYTCVCVRVSNRVIGSRRSTIDRPMGRRRRSGRRHWSLKRERRERGEREGDERERGREGETEREEKTNAERQGGGV